MREAYAKGTLPLLRVGEWRDDIETARAAMKTLSHGARTLVFFGTGGSSLGGQTLAQLGGWGIPGDDKHGSDERPRTRFYDNLDARTLELGLAGLDLKTSRFVVISKSGGTPETSGADLRGHRRGCAKRGLEASIPDMFLAVTEPAAKASPTACARSARHSRSRFSTTTRISGAAFPASPMSGCCRRLPAASMWSRSEKGLKASSRHSLRHAPLAALRPRSARPRQ